MVVSPCPDPHHLQIHPSHPVQEPLPLLIIPLNHKRQLKHENNLNLHQRHIQTQRISQHSAYWPHLARLAAHCKVVIL